MALAIEHPLRENDRDNEVHEITAVNRKRTRASWENDLMRCQGGRHQIIIKPADVPTRTSNYERGDCIVCKKTVNTQCCVCGVFLCIKSDQGIRTCDRIFHSKAKFPDTTDRQKNKIPKSRRTLGATPPPTTPAAASSAPSRSTSGRRRYSGTTIV